MRYRLNIPSDRPSSLAGRRLPPVADNAKSGPNRLRPEPPANLSDRFRLTKSVDIGSSNKLRRCRNSPGGLTLTEGRRSRTARCPGRRWKPSRKNGTQRCGPGVVAAPQAGAGRRGGRHPRRAGRNFRRAGRHPRRAGDMRAVLAYTVGTEETAMQDMRELDSSGLPSGSGLDCGTETISAARAITRTARPAGAGPSGGSGGRRAGSTHGHGPPEAQSDDAPQGDRGRSVTEIGEPDPAFSQPGDRKGMAASPDVQAVSGRPAGLPGASRSRSSAARTATRMPREDRDTNA
jgi:hypothetical protein